MSSTRGLPRITSGGGGGGGGTISEIVAGAGLTGSGLTGPTATLDVIANADGSIVVNPNDIQVGVLATDAQHGNRGGGSLHALATGAVAGFMSAADKTTFDAHLSPIDTANPHQVTQQQTYDQASDITLSAAQGAMYLTDNATPIGGDLFAVRNNTPANLLFVQTDEVTVAPNATGAQRWRVTDTEWELGRAGRRLFRGQWPDATGRMAIEVFPDDYTISTATGGSSSVFYSDAGRTITTSIPGGAPFGNDSAPGFANLQHTVRFTDPGNVFATQLLVNAAVKLECAANIGPTYLFLDQYQTYADGGSRTSAQHNVIRAQPSWGPNIGGGSITQTSAEYFFMTATVDGTVGTTSVTLLNYLAPKAPTLIAGGTIGTLNVLDIPNIPAAGITTLRGINSAMGSGTFINHTGAADAIFTAADFRFNNNFGVELGTGQNVKLNWNGSAFEWDPATGDDLRIAFASGSHTLTSSSAGATRQIRFGMPKFAFGQTSALGNQKGIFVANAETITVGGTNFDQYLLTQGGNDTINAAIDQYSGWRLNTPTPTIGTGSLNTLSVLQIDGSPAVGAVNRVGLRITSNPSGGSGVNAALWVTTGRTQLDGVFEHAGSTFGAQGATPIAQPAAYTVTNHTPDRTYDANASSVAELADVLGTLIDDLINYGFLQGSVT